MALVKLKQIKWPPAGLHLWVEAYINHNKVFLVVDTGASQTVLDVNMAATLQLKNISTSEVVSTGVSGPVSNSIAVANTFQIGTTNLKKVKVVLIDLSTVNAAYATINKKPVHGILGGDVLKKTNAVINYEKGTLKLRSKK